MRRLIALLPALVLAACATAPTEPPPSAGAGERMVWILSTDGRDEPALFYGVPESDHILLMMACGRGAGAIEVTIFGAADRPVGMLHLQSAGARLRSAARSERSLLHDETISTTVAADAPVLARFAETGVLGVGTSPGPVPFPAAPVATAARFVEICRG